MPDELWTEVRHIAQETGIKTIPMEKKCKKAKWLSGEALQIAMKRREAKSKGEKERYKHLNDGVITHLEPDILEWEVKWALESITANKASGGDGIPVELFQILKDDAVKVLYSICQQIWKTQQWPQDWKRSVFIPIPKKGNAKECSNYTQLHSSHTLAK